MASERAKKLASSWYLLEGESRDELAKCVDKALLEERREACKPLVDALILARDCLNEDRDYTNVEFRELMKEINAVLEKSQK